jgi:hypothetical protein
MKSAIFTIGLTLGLAAVLGIASTAAAQPILQRLEQAIRERVGEPVNPGETPAEPAEPKGVRKGPDQGPGYLGAIADDKKDRGRGVRVLEVRPDGPAAKAGLKPNDLIVSAAGIRVRQMSDLADVLALFPAGSTLGLEILRGERQQLMKVTLGRHPGAKPPAGEGPEALPPPPGTEQPLGAGPTPAAPGSYRGSAEPPTSAIPAVPGPLENPVMAPPPATPIEPPLAGPNLPMPAVPADRLAEQQAKIEQLLQRIEKLEERNKQLEKRIEELEKALAEAAKKQ